MGSFFKSQTVTLPQQTPRPVASTPFVPAPSEPTKSNSEIQAEARQQSLLRRNRGVLGTIATSFSGFLQPKDTGSNRKTLLGE